MYKTHCVCVDVSDERIGSLFLVPSDQKSLEINSKATYCLFFGLASMFNLLIVIPGTRFLTGDGVSALSPFFAGLVNPRRVSFMPG